jgi:DnaK suppressor protein
MAASTRDAKKLDAKTVRELERFLRQSLTELRTQVRDRVAERRSTEVARSADVTIQASDTLHDEIQTALIDRRARQVALIQGALERLGRGEYGLCRGCEEFIGLPRLRALPFAQRCSRCQSLAEASARRGGVAAVRPPRLELDQEDAAA